jgi:predicted CXXCH cytochrome family protein
MKATWTMRAATAFAAACAASLLVCAAAAADNGPHVKGSGGLTPAGCALCHRAHTGRAAYLLKENQEALCFTCHGSSAAGSSLDVADGVGYSGAGHTGAKGALRGGGFKDALIDSGHPSGNFSEEADVPVLGALAPVTSAHSIDESEQIAWGNGPISAGVNYGAKIRLTCGSCHDPHGNGMYRVLKPIPTESGTTKEVKIEEPAGMEHVYTTENYWEVEDESDPSFIANISAWCATCHTRLLAGRKSAVTNSGDAVYAFRHRTNEGSESSPTCIKCHVAHGTDATMGSYAAAVRNPDGSAAGAASFLLRIDNRGVCEMCHHK